LKLLLRLTALIEIATGLALLAVPAVVIQILLGAEITGATVPLARVAGVALLALGVACWLGSYDTQSCASRGVVSAMVIYNVGVVFVLASVGKHWSPVGVALWPTVILHVAMAAWCVASLARSRKPDAK
jgi:hypothetical protein